MASGRTSIWGWREVFRIILASSSNCAIPSCRKTNPSAAVAAMMGWSGLWGGREDVPALGFAFVLERLQEALDLERGDGQRTSPRRGILMLAQSPASFPLALEAALALREEGAVVEMEVFGRDLEEGLAYAEARGLAEVVLIDDNGYLSRHNVGGSDAKE